MKKPGCSEHYVIHVLRDDPDFVKELDFVVEKDGTLIGPQGYYVKDEDVEAFDMAFVPKQKLKLPGQIF